MKIQKKNQLPLADSFATQRIILLIDFWWKNNFDFANCLLKVEPNYSSRDPRNSILSTTAYYGESSLVESPTSLEDHPFPKL